MEAATRAWMGCASAGSSSTTGLQVGVVSATGGTLRHAFGATLVFRRRRWKRSAASRARAVLATLRARRAHRARGGRVVLSRYIVETRWWRRVLRAVPPRDSDGPHDARRAAGGLFPRRGDVRVRVVGARARVRGRGVAGSSPVGWRAVAVASAHAGARLLVRSAVRSVLPSSAARRDGRPCSSPCATRSRSRCGRRASWTHRAVGTRALVVERVGGSRRGDGGVRGRRGASRGVVTARADGVREDAVSASPSFEGFDGGAGSRYQARRRDPLVLVSDVARTARGAGPGVAAVDAPPRPHAKTSSASRRLRARRPPTSTPSSRPSQGVRR